MIDNLLLVRWVEMETNRKFARREPPAAGLAACPYRGTGSMMYCSHNGIKKNVQLRTVHHLFLSSAKLPFAGLLPNGPAHSVSTNALRALVEIVIEILFAGAKIEKIFISLLILM